LFIRTTVKKVIQFKPMLVVAMYLSVGILLGYTPKVDSVFVVSLCILLSVVAFFTYVYNHSIPLILLALISLAIGFTSVEVKINFVVLPDQECDITGRVVEKKEFEFSTSYILDDCTIITEQRTPLKHKVQIFAKDENLTFGDVIKTTAKIDYLKSASNINGFDLKKYYISNGIGYTAKSKEAEIVVIQNVTKLDTYLFKSKAYLTTVIDRLYSEDVRGIAKGLFLGEKEDIDPETYEKFKRGGTASVLAVSGLHFGIIIFFIYGLLLLISSRRNLALIITGIVITFYAGLVGFTISATRALIMAWVGIISKLLAKKTDALSIVSFAYVLSLLINPVSIFSVGFILSFAAVFSIITVTPVIAEKLKFMPKSLSGFIATSVSATLGTAPIIINFFSYFSLIGIIANIIIIPIASITVILVMISAILGSNFGLSIAFLAEHMIKSMDTIMVLLLKIPYSSFTVKQLPELFILLWYIIIFIVSNYCLIAKKSKKILTIALIFIMIILLIIPLFEKDQLEIYFFDVRQGDATFIQTRDNKHYMIDCGKKSNYQEIERFLKSRNIVLDGIFLSHSDEDHSGSLIQLVENDLVNKIYVSLAGCPYLFAPTIITAYSALIFSNNSREELFFDP